MKIWCLYSSRADPYNEWELIELFSSEEQARQARDMLVGQVRQVNSPFRAVWDDEDLHVAPLDLR